MSTHITQPRKAPSTGTWPAISHLFSIYVSQTEWGGGGQINSDSCLLLIKLHSNDPVSRGGLGKHSSLLLASVADEGDDEEEEEEESEDSLGLFER